MSHKLDLPEFADEDEEREFWANVDLGDYLKPEDFEPVAFPNLKPTELLEGNVTDSVGV